MLARKSALNADHKSMRVEDAFERGAPVRIRAAKLVLPIGKIIVAQVCVVACASENAP